MESFGASLKRERERRKISLDEVAASTKISTRMLSALEEEHFDLLPGGIFNRGFVRAYARVLGIDENKAVANYMAAAGENAPAANPELNPQHNLKPDPKQKTESARSIAAETAAANRHSKRGDIPWSVLVLALVIAAVLFALWRVQARKPAARTKPVFSEYKSNATPVSPDPASSTPASATSAQNDSPPGVPALEPVSQSVAEVSPNPAPALQRISDNKTANQRKKGFGVRILATADCWLTLTQDGKEIFQGVLTAGTERTLHPRAHLLVKAGSVGALEIAFDGEKVPAQGALGDVRLLSFGINGLESEFTDSTHPDR